jgi:DNA-binding CsgD family transcriptional regulator
MIPWQTLLFSLVFAVSAGLAIMGGWVSVRYASSERKPAGTFLVYQQLFIYAFLLYGVWGNLFLQKLMEGWGLAEGVRLRITTVQPLLGLPFLLAAWYMLIRFFGTITGMTWGRRATLIYLFACVAVFPLIFLLATKSPFLAGKITPSTPVSDPAFAGGSFFPVYTLIASANALIHLILLVPVILNYKKLLREECRESRFFLPGYFLAVALSTFLTLMVPGHHDVFALMALLMVFLSNLLLPLCTGGLVLTSSPAGKESSTAGPGSPATGRTFPYRELLEGGFPEGTATEGAPQAGISPEGDAPAAAFEAFCLKYDISRREAEIIREIRAGKSNREIADTLFITLQTVKDHIHRIFTKTGVSNRVQLINLSGRNHPSPK